MGRLIFLILPILCSILTVNGLKVLSIFPMHSHSHFTLGFNLLKEMAHRGHEIYFINPYPQKTPIPNFKDISITSIIKPLNEIKKHLFKLEGGTPIDNFRYMSKMGRALTDLSLQSEDVQKLLKSNEKFDVILIEHFFNEAQFALGHHFKAPVVLLSPMPSSILNNHLFANPAPSTYVHSLFAPFTQNMDLWERFKNFYYDMWMTYYQYFDELPAQKLIMEKYFPDAPPFYEILYNSSIMLVNSHPSFSDPVPHMANVIEIGGYHVPPPKPVTGELKQYLDDAPNGVVLFSMGSILKSHIFPKEKRDCLIRAFSKIKQKVLWKFDVDIPDLPSNIKIVHWLPQNDILAHPNIRLFVTHGGLLSTIETIYHGVPTIGIPVFSDQKMNIANAVNYGFAINVPFDSITEEKMSIALDEALNNPKYAENAKMRSKIMHDQQVKPIDKAIYWLEYVVRHKGATHLRSAGIDLIWYQRYLLDVAAIALLSLVTFIVLLKITIKSFCSKSIKNKHSKKE